MSAVMMEVLNFEGQRDGPVFVVLGGVHGDEPGGPRAIRHIENMLNTGQMELTAGELILIPEVNREALKRGVRYIDRDLNRNLGEVETTSCHEDSVANELCQWLRQADVLLDLHAYGAGDTPFVFLGPPNEDEKAFALSLGPTHFCWGFQDVTSKAQDQSTAIGTTEYCRKHGGFGVTLECGNKNDLAATSEVAQKAIVNALSHLSMIRMSGDMSPDHYDKKHFVKLQKSVIKKRDGCFTKNWSHLDQVRKNEVIAQYDSDEDIKSDQDGFIVLPDPEAEIDTNWFYIGVEQDP